MRARVFLIAALTAWGCASPPVDEPIDARWILKPGDAISIRIRTDQTGFPHASLDVDAIFRVREAAPDGSYRGTVEIVRFVAESEGDRGMKLVYERGAVSESRGLEEEQRRSMFARIGRPTESRLSPGGILSPVNPGDPATFASWPLGVALPGREIRGTESWKGEIRAAHCDEVETEYRFETSGERMRIAGRSTPKAEEQHRIRVRVEGSYLPGSGIVEEGRLEVDFSPLGMISKTTVRFAIRRR
jgi:hypothetical protein